MSKGKTGTGKLNGFERFLRWIARSDSVFGSDVYVNYTHEYVWQANQFGHVCVGLLVGLLLIWILGGSVYGFLAVVGLYALKEFLDYEIAVRLQEGVFEVKRWEALSDGIADWGFVTLGAVLALFVMNHVPPLWGCGQSCTGLTSFWLRWADMLDGWGIGAALIAPVVDFFVLGRIYLPAKRAHDKSGLPLLVRLPTFPNNFGLKGPALDRLAKRISAFAIAGANGRDDNTCEIRQILISGPPESGRTTLALSIGGEATNVCTKVRYLGAERLREKADAKQEIQSDVKQPYAVAEADLVIVDDVDLPIEPIEETCVKLRALIGARDDVNVFRRPLGKRKQTATNRKPDPPSPDARKNDPALVWVVANEKGLEAANKAIQRVFGLKEEHVLEIRLIEELESTRRKTAAASHAPS